MRSTRQRLLESPTLSGDGGDLAIISYGNGAYLSRRAAHRLKTEEIDARIIDLRWLSPLPIDEIIEAIGARRDVLIVDECRKTGSPSEEIIAGFADRGLTYNLARIAGADTFIPLGPAADTVLVSEDDILAAARALVAEKTKRAAE